MNLDNINIVSTPKLKLTSSQIKNILKDYYNGISSSKIENEYNLKVETVFYLRKIMNLPRFKPFKYSNENLEKIVQEHINGKLIKDIEKEYGISNYTIYRYMKMNNITFKNDHGRKNNFNKNYFETIDTEHKAYWLGFIMADGCISNTGSGNTKPNRLTINISNKDIELLKAFCNDIEYNGSKIKIYKPKGTYSDNLMCKIYLNSIKLCSDLIDLGIVPNKTNKLNNIPNIPQELIRHFIRGYFDGDGWTVNGKNFSSVGFIGDYNLLLEINLLLSKNINTSKRNLYKENRIDFPIYYLKYYSIKDLNLLYDYLYNNSTIFLKRKFENFNKII